MRWHFYITARWCDVTLQCNIIYNNPDAQLLLPSWPAAAAGSAAAARRGGCQFAGIGLLHPPLHFKLLWQCCATRQPFSLLHAVDMRVGANRPAAIRVIRQWRGCRRDSRFAFASEAAWSRGSRGSGGAAQPALGGQWSEPGWKTPAQTREVRHRYHNCDPWNKWESRNEMLLNSYQFLKFDQIFEIKTWKQPTRAIFLETYKKMQMQPVNGSH